MLYLTQLLYFLKKKPGLSQVIGHHGVLECVHDQNDAIAWCCHEHRRQTAFAGKISLTTGRGSTNGERKKCSH